MSRYFVPAAAMSWPAELGFGSDAASVHGSRSIMLSDLSVLLDAVPATADMSAYRRAVQEDNVLGKKTSSTRLWAFKKLRELYGLDPSKQVFAELLTRWHSDTEGRPLLALLAALCRDSLLRASVPVISGTNRGQEATREQFASAIQATRGDRFSAVTMKAVLSHLLTSWTDSGHLIGRGDRIRARVVPTTSVVVFALSLGYLAGFRGTHLFGTLFTSVLDTSQAQLRDHAREASRRGWLHYRGIEEIAEIDFPKLRGISQVTLFPHSGDGLA